MKNSTIFLKPDNFVFAQYKKNLKFGKIKLKLKEFHRSKQPIYLNQVETNKTVNSDEFKLDDNAKNFIGYRNGEIVKPLCIIYFTSNLSNTLNKKKNMLFLVDDGVIFKYNKIQKN